MRGEVFGGHIKEGDPLFVRSTSHAHYNFLVMSPLFRPIAIGDFSH